MAKTALEIDAENEKSLRNPHVDFTGLPNLASQVGWKTIPQEINDFEKAGRAIMVSNADANFPEVEGLPAYPDPIEARLLETEVNAQLLIARKRLAEDQEEAVKDAQRRAEKNQAELERIKAMAPPKPIEPTTE
ncbi:MAG: hypothetical protein [Arizlama microvirus]|nr:MAG: hypothetical protein [Arizlama microvirus]